MASKRPDVSVVIIDFVRQNLIHAKNVLGSLIGNQVALLHGDATSLPFPVAGETGHSMESGQCRPSNIFQITRRPVRKPIGYVGDLDCLLTIL